MRIIALTRARTMYMNWRVGRLHITKLVNIYWYIWLGNTPEGCQDTGFASQTFRLTSKAYM